MHMLRTSVNGDVVYFASWKQVSLTNLSYVSRILFRSTSKYAILLTNRTDHFLFQSQVQSFETFKGSFTFPFNTSSFLIY